MANIRQRGAKFQVQVRMPGFPSRTETFPTRRLAERWGKTVEAEMIEGKHFRGTSSRRRSVAEAIDKFAAEYVPAKKDARNTLIRLAWWKERVGALKLFDLTGETVAAELAKLAAEPFTRSKAPGARKYVRSVTTVNRYAAALSRMCTIARRSWRWMEHHPFESVMREKEPRSTRRSLSAAERPRFLAACATCAVDSPESFLLHVIAHVALSGCPRVGEILPRRWREWEVDEKKLVGRFNVPETKNGDARTVWVFGEACRLMVELYGRAERRERGGPDDYVFASWRYADKVFDYQAPFEKAKALAGITDRSFVFHSLRHTAATALAREGATDAQLKACGGWKSNVVSIYTHLAGGDVVDVLERMNKKAANGGKGEGS